MVAGTDVIRGVGALTTVKVNRRIAEANGVTDESSRNRVPAYLAGTMLLRGSARRYVTYAVVVLHAFVGLYLQYAFDTQTNAPSALSAIVIAWMWGRNIGGAYGGVGTLVNGIAAYVVGLEIGDWGAVIADAVVIGGIAFFIGHVATILEVALGERERAAEARDEFEARARNRMLKITDKVPIGLYRTTSEGRITGGNDALMRILGFADQEAMLRANVWDLYVDPSQRQSKVTGTGQAPEWTEFQLKRQDGSIIWVRDWAVAVRDSAGALRHFDGVLEDITETRLADERFRAAFDDSPYGMAISTTDGFLVRGNQAIAELLGRDLDTLTNIHFSQFTFEDEMDITPMALAKAEAGEVVRYEKRLKRADGGFIWALISLAPIYDGSDTQLFISHVIDITERQQVRQGLENLVRSKDDLIASVSHELRTPLTVVHGLAQELDANWMSFSVPEQKEFITMIVQQSGEVAHIVEDLLVAARADIGKLPIVAKQLDIRDEIDATLPSVPDVKPVLEQVGSVPPVAFADPSRVRQILRNLLVNAHRYGGPTLSVRYGTDGHTAWIEVMDDGPGVAPDEVATIFEPYERAHSAAGQPMSVGLGLTVSRTLADMMGGSLEYSYDGEWSTFRLDLPVPGSVHLGR